MYPEGKVTDYGDLLHVERWIVKGLRLHFHLRIGPVDPRSEPPTSTFDVSTASPAVTGRTNPSMDLRADQQVVLSGGWTDEVGNPVPAPPQFTVVYTVDNTTVITLTDNNDGTAVAVATGVLGTANVHAEANTPGMPTMTADLQIVVVAGLAERFTIVAGTPTEVTPDEPTP